MISARFAPVLSGLIPSGLTGLIVSGLCTARAVRLVEGLPGLWLGNWAVSWSIAFPTVLVVAPWPGGSWPGWYRRVKRPEPAPANGRCPAAEAPDWRLRSVQSASPPAQLKQCCNRLWRKPQANRAGRIARDDGIGGHIA
ncbi:MAG: DUF2798 domain-containing protein [Tabrizicola sp.]|nr:DUF2798 domain-containing protein [Tabrizicola sp.]